MLLKDRVQRELRRFQRGLGLPPNLALEARQNPVTKYSQHVSTDIITFPERKLFSKQDTFFAMGSCFAEEIRIALNEKGIACVPKYRRIHFDPSEAVVDELPDRGKRPV